MQQFDLVNNMCDKGLRLDTYEKMIDVASAECPAAPTAHSLDIVEVMRKHGGVPEPLEVFTIHSQAAGCTWGSKFLRLDTCEEDSAHVGGPLLQHADGRCTGPQVQSQLKTNAFAQIVRARKWSTVLTRDARDARAIDHGALSEKQKFRSWVFFYLLWQWKRAPLWRG